MAQRLSSWVQSASDSLSMRVSGLSLAVFRIAMGALLVWDCWRFIHHDRIFRYYVAPDFHFTYPGFGWVVPLPEPWIHIAWLAMGGFAALVMVGLFYRVAIVGLTVVFSYFFLLDRAEYLNHFYLVILFLILMCFLPANRRLSLDARLWPDGGERSVPYGAIFVLRAQMEIMLIYAGVVKLTPDWLAGEPLGLWLRSQSASFPFGFLFHYDWVILLGTWSTVALHILGAPLLLWKKTRLATFLVYCVFHAANSIFFNIGIFPWLTIAATTIFFAPDWPHRVARWLLGRFEPLPDLPKPIVQRPSTRLPAIALAAIAGWLTIQVALPARAWVLPTDVRWSGEGHLLSWRMRIFDRQADGQFVVVANGQEWVVDPSDYLTARQASKMLVRPDMIHQFAQYLKDLWIDTGYSQVAVRADIQKSLNGRPMQQFSDPQVDLTSVALSMTGNDWIVPIEQAVWGVAQNDPIVEPAPDQREPTTEIPVAAR